MLPNKTQQTYSNMWNKVLDLCATACPTHLIVDFEIASINAFSQHFLTTKFQGCFFHLCQNVLPKAQHFGLAARYKQDVEFAIQVRMLPALAFATPTDIPDLFNNLFYKYLWKHTIWHYTLKLLILVDIRLIPLFCHHHYFQWKCGTNTSWFSMGYQGQIMQLRHGTAHLLVTCLGTILLYGVF